MAENEKLYCSCEIRKSLKNIKEVTAVIVPTGQQKSQLFYITRETEK